MVLTETHLQVFGCYFSDYQSLDFNTQFWVEWELQG
jgi:hypothetical protein